MARPVAQNRGQADKAATEKRAKLIKESLEYWKILQSKWGAKDVGLTFGMGSRNAGEYHQEWEGKPASIRLFLPGVSAWSNARGTTTLTEAKRIMRHELAHHRQFLKENAGKEGVGRNPDVHLPTQNERWHGPDFQKQAAQMGGGKADLREPPKPVDLPLRRRPRKNIAKIFTNNPNQGDRYNAGGGRRAQSSGPPVRTGPPDDRRTDEQRFRRNTG